MILEDKKINLPIGSFAIFWDLDCLSFYCLQSTQWAIWSNLR